MCIVVSWLLRISRRSLSLNTSTPGPAPCRNTQIQWRAEATPGALQKYSDSILRLNESDFWQFVPAASVALLLTKLEVRQAGDNSPRVSFTYISDSKYVNICVCVEFLPDSLMTSPPPVVMFKKVRFAIYYIVNISTCTFVIAYTYLHVSTYIYI